MYREEMYREETTMGLFRTKAAVRPAHRAGTAANRVSETTSWATWYSHHLGPALLRQQQLRRCVHDLSWQLDLQTGCVQFGGHRELVGRAHMLGTISADGTWVWSWAEAGSKLPPQVVTRAVDVKSAAQRDGLSLYTCPTIRATEEDVAELLLVASGVAGELPLYRGPYDGGAAYFLVDGLQLPPAVTPEVAGAIEEALNARDDLDYRTVVHRTAQAAGCFVQDDEDTLLVVTGRGEVIDRFDAFGRVRDLTGSPSWN